MTKKLYIKTYGCQMNVYDSQKMADILTPYGYTITETPEGADLVILNTCHIREKAEHKMYSDLGRVRQANQGIAQGELPKDPPIIAVGGCVAQAEGAEIMRQAPFVDIVFGPQMYHRLPEMIARAARARDQKTDEKTGKKSTKGRGVVEVDFPIESKFDHLPTTSTSSASAFLSIQEGCDKFCTFCVVPYTRGAEYSRPVQDVLAEARHLIAQGAREITLLGQNVNAYHGESARGRDYDFGELIQELAGLDSLARIRYTTSHPRDMTDSLYHAHRDVPALMPFIHLPVQSGSDRILEAMNRKHTADLYFKVIDRLRDMRADLAFSSDFIVGFPGETETDFQKTLDLIDYVQYALVYSFKYSIRPGTPAGLLENQVSELDKSDRLTRLQEKVNAQQLAFNQRSAGQIVPVLVEREGRQDGLVFGKTPHFQTVLFSGATDLIGKIVNVKITDTHQNSLNGELVGS